MENKYFKVIPQLSQVIETEPEEEIYPLSAEMHAQDQRYTPGDELGRGGMKKIINAQDQLTSRDVAQAFLIDSSDPQNIESFFKEAKLTAGLQHPNIIPLYDAGFDNMGQAFFTMKPVEGTNLGDLVREMREDHQRIDYQELMAIFLKICDAISYAHSKQVIHLDLKPDNIQIGEFGEVLVADWGLAKVLGSEKTHFDSGQFDPHLFNETTQHGLLKGTPGFMAPEQIDPKKGKKDRQTDIYAMGALLYTLLCLRPPHQSDNIKTIVKSTLSGAIQAPSYYQEHIPSSLESIAMKALSLEKEQRYSSVLELSQDIKKWQGGFVTSAESHHFLKSFYFLLKRHRQASAFLSILILLSFFFIGRIIQEKNFAQQQALIANQQKQLTEVQRQKVIQQKQIVEAQKNETEKAFGLYKLEQQQRQAISKNASPRLHRLARTNLNDYNYEEALQDSQLAVLWDPLDQGAQLSYSLILLYTQNFSKALEVVKEIDDSSSSRRQKQILVIASQYAPLKKSSKPLALNHLIDLMERYPSTSFTSEIIGKPDRMLFHFVNSAYTQNYTLNEKVSIAERALQLSSAYDHTWKIPATIQQGKVDVDLSKQNRLRRIEALARFPMRSLKLANSSIKSIKPLFNSHVEHLDLRHYPIEITELKNFKNLTSVTLTTNQLPSLKIRKIKVIRKD